LNTLSTTFVPETLAWVYLLNSESAIKSSKILQMKRQKKEKDYKRLKGPMP
jgi:hypothetical protein